MCSDLGTKPVLDHHPDSIPPEPFIHIFDIMIPQPESYYLASLADTGERIGRLVEVDAF
jgi:hypothetical protein